MKYFVKFFVVTFFLLFSTDVIAEQKIVVLDLKYVLNNSKAGKNAQDFLKKSYNNNLKKYADMEKALKKEEQDLLTKKTVLNKEEYTKSYIEHRECFSEKLRIYNIFNRIIMYDTREWHGANSYYNGDGKDDRLTLTFFVGGIVSKSKFPLKRIKNSEYETVIKNQMGNYENK